MEYIKQRIIFDVPGEITVAQIISDILKKNGVMLDTVEDLFNEKKLPKITVAINTTKDLFDKKIAEDKMSGLFQEQFQIPKESAISIIKELKEKIIPFGKKIELDSIDKLEVQKIPESGTTGENNIISNKLKTLINMGNGKDVLTLPTNELINKNNIPEKKTQRIKKIIKPGTITQNEVPAKKSTGPDAYREPIE